MFKLLEKEFKLNIHWLFPVATILFALLIFIPEWVYSIAFFYLYWICIPNIYSAYNAQKDFTFTQMLPVSKGQIVQSKIAAIVLLQALQLAACAIVAAARNTLYGQENFALDLTPAFFGLMLVIYGGFNLIFFPGYFKTAYHYGKPFLFGLIFATLAAAAAETANALSPAFKNFMEGGGALGQWAALLAGLAAFAALTYLAVRASIKRFGA